ncbi:MAG: hemolysin III family protein [Bacteroidales bacterium]|jgi:hemolysin III
MKPIARQYSVQEEKLNVITHGIGLLLSIVALIVLVVSASLYGTVWHIVSFSIYGASLVVLYLASTLFHAAKNQEVRNYLNIFDHSSIYFLIAGTYTPFVLVTLNGPWGWSLFGVIWGLAIAGMVFKLWFTGHYDKASAIAYVLMGLIILFAIVPLVNNLEMAGLVWLLAGGVAYILGAGFYLWHKFPYNHAIFHVWVLIGSFCHFVAVYWYVL